MAVNGAISDADMLPVASNSYFCCLFGNPYNKNFDLDNMFFE